MAGIQDILAGYFIQFNPTIAPPGFIGNEI